jgi:hypothetical protein
LERRIEEAEEEKLDLEQRIGEAFEGRENREGRRLNRQLERTRTLLVDLYDQCAVKA